MIPKARGSEQAIIIPSLRIDFRFFPSWFPPGSFADLMGRPGRETGHTREQKAEFGGAAPEVAYGWAGRLTGHHWGGQKSASLMRTQ